MLNIAKAFEDTNSVKSEFHGLCYDKVFAKYEDVEFKLLEIGIFKGSSLVAWHNVFPKATIFGLDRVIPVGKAFPDISFATTFTGDQSWPPFMEKVARDVAEIDVVIDDGGHFSDDQQVSFNALWPVVKKGGLYIIEDLWAAKDNIVNGFECTLDFLDKLDIRKEFYEGFFDFKKDICVLYKE